MSKLTPEEMVKAVAGYAKNLSAARNAHVAVGLPKDKVGGKVYGGGMTILRLAAIHNYGGVFKGRGGKTFVMPRRDFMRMPFEVQRRKLALAIVREFQGVAEKGTNAKLALGRVGVEAVNIQQGAFITTGYGQWKPSKKPSGQTLIDTGLLRNSLTWSVRANAS